MKATVISAGLNLHRDPNGEVIDQLSQGEALEVIGPPSNTATVRWRYVRVPRLNEFGWVAEKFIAIEARPDPMPRPGPVVIEVKPPVNWWLVAIVAGASLAALWLLAHL